MAQFGAPSIQRMDGLRTRSTELKRRIFACAVFGGTVFVGLWFHLARAERRLNARQAMTRVVVARRYVPQGKTVPADFVEEREIPVAYLQPTALRSVNDLKNKEGEF